ncbi:MAG: class I SAM-dependent methyltransferase [Sideroxydans sp.]|nr:class I SAM-dependent methyltransferase [Sideroxydans sp.]
MILTGSAQDMYESLRELYPEAPEPLMPGAQMRAYQMLALYGLVRQFNSAGMAILEIGTGHGNSAYMLSKAAPEARIVSLSLNKHEAWPAQHALWRAQCGNVQVRVMRSDRYRRASPDVLWDMIYVDGDHKHILVDMPWWNRVRPGGLMVFHDYSKQACPPVFQALNDWRQRLGREFDVLVVDSEGIGMAGWYRREGELWQE